MIHELCQCRQAGCTDSDTEGRRAKFLEELWAAERAMQRPPQSVNRIVEVLAASTASSTAETWSCV